MPQDNATNTSDSNMATGPGGVVPGPTQPTATSDVVVTPGLESVAKEPVVDEQAQRGARTEIAAKLGEAKNVLIALSSDPSVDELSAAIGLSLYLDRIGKRATAIYSGSTPNTLEFLKPEETFEATADTLQDFVIAINKDKADHLRYKLDGDFVKVYITPYKHRLSEGDLEFSYGDYNVDLVMALDVANGIDLDKALREHGRIMHDALIVNVTTGNPGKFGEIEWSDKHASSVSEMIAGLLYQYGGEDPIAKDEATAFLTGIVAATNRFSNKKTTSETMRLASRLMESGANQQLVSKNITPDVENELFNKGGAARSANDDVGGAEVTKLDIEHGYEKRAAEREANEALVAEEAVKAVEEINADVTKKEHTLLDDLKVAEESLSHAGEEATPVSEQETLKIENGRVTSGDGVKAPEPVLPEPVMPVAAESSAIGATGSSVVGAEPVGSELATSKVVTPEPVAVEPVTPEAAEPVAATAESSVIQETAMPEEGVIDKPEKVLEPSADFNANATSGDAERYGQMLQDALNTVPTPVEPTGTIVSEGVAAAENPMEVPTFDNNAANPAVMGAPAVPTTPEINGVPEMNYMPTPGVDILPPPPAPPVDGMPMSAPMPAATSEPVAPNVPQEGDPSAFRIPGIQ